jgi:hypothetical protein
MRDMRMACQMSPESRARRRRRRRRRRICLYNRMHR